MRYEFRLSQIGGPYWEKRSLSEGEGEPISFDPSKPQQTIIGFGGAFTEAAAHVYASMSPALKRQTIALCFGEDGLRYNLGRTTIGSCDFSLSQYDYARKDDLSDFSLRHDEKEIIPFLKDAEKSRPLPLLASSWSPPAEWKTNGSKLQGGRLKKDCYGIYADYLAKYVETMAENGLPIEFLTPQNEPLAAQTWESCLYGPAEEAKLILELKKRMPNIKILAYDHNRDKLWDREKDIFRKREVKEAVHGMAYHWYFPGGHEEIAKCLASFPDKPLIQTESCVELLNLNRADPAAAIGNPEGMRRYAKDRLEDLRNGSSGFIDWNLLLDLKGGPNHVGNYCEAPLMSDGTRLLINPSYYAIKHLSRFIDPNSRLIASAFPMGIVGAAFLNPDGGLSLVMLNEGEGKAVSLFVENHQCSCYLNGNSICSIRIWQTLKQTKK